MPITFEEVAARVNIWGRAFLSGPSGSGKSRGALELATRLFGGELDTTLIATEPDRARLYADRYRHALIDLSADGDYAPERFVEAMDLAEKRRPGGVIVIDSATHEWNGHNGTLQIADKKFQGWAAARPRHNAFVDRIKWAQSHIIVCCRSKPDFLVEDGGKKITEIGVAPVTDDGLPYEFTLTGRFEIENKTVTFSGGHVESLEGQTFDMVRQGDVVADAYSKWLSEGDPIAQVEDADPADVERLLALLVQDGIEQAVIDEKLDAARRQNRGKLTPEYVAEQTAKAEGRLSRKAARSKTDGAAAAAPEAAPQETLTPA